MRESFSITGKKAWLQLPNFNPHTIKYIIMIIFGKNFLDLAYWPIYGSAFFLLWTATTSPWSNYGDLWVIIPAILTFPMAFCLHIFLLVKNDWKIKFVFLWNCSPCNSLCNISCISYDYFKRFIVE